MFHLSVMIYLFKIYPKFSFHLSLPITAFMYINSLLKDRIAGNGPANKSGEVAKSGRNALDSKSSYGKPYVGSNPTLSATIKTRV